MSFACALDWPGWCRRGKTEDEALEALASYRDRYSAAVGSRPHATLDVVGTVKGNATTDFGAPAATTPWERSLKKTDLGRLEACWSAFDAVVASAPAALAKGPRGGGRDRDEIVEHVREAERAYGRKAGVKVPPRTPWPEQRVQLVEGLRQAPDDAAWPPSYAVRRIAWHVLDHAWEIEDKS